MVDILLNRLQELLHCLHHSNWNTKAGSEFGRSNGHSNWTATEMQEVKEDEEEDGILDTFTPSGFRVPWEDRHYLSTSKHLFSHEKWGVGVGELKRRRNKQWKGRAACLHYSPVLIHSSTQEWNPNWKSNCNQDICVFVYHSREQIQKFRERSIEDIYRKNM